MSAIARALKLIIDQEPDVEAVIREEFGDDWYQEVQNELSNLNNIIRGTMPQYIVAKISTDPQYHFDLDATKDAAQQAIDELGAGDITVCFTRTIEILSTP